MNHALEESYRFCAVLSRREARNFYYSFLLLPANRRRSMCALYAFLRHSDDLADEPGEFLAKQAAIDAWRNSLDRSLHGEREPDTWPGLPALADTVARHAIPARYLHEVLDGVVMDLQPRPFANFEELTLYCKRVASAVGRCCLHIWGFTSAEGRAESLADDCGLALQLTNILRDVKEDAQNGRVYLPQDDLERFQVAPEELSGGTLTDRLRSILEFEARRAYDFYDRAELLVGLVDPVGRPVLRTIVGIYRALLDEIVARGYDVMAARVSVPSWRKAAIALRSWSGRSRPPALGLAESPR